MSIGVASYMDFLAHVWVDPCNANICENHCQQGRTVDEDWTICDAQKKPSGT